MENFEITYGKGITLHLGSLRDADPANNGDFVTPSFASGDVTTEQDDGTGFENADDPTPDLDGQSIELDISTAEAAVPSALGGRRVYRIIDQTAPNVWIPREICIVTTDHHLAAKPNGVIYREDALVAIAAGTVTLHASNSPANTSLRSCVAVVVDSDTLADIGACAKVGESGYDGAVNRVATFESNWTRTPTGTLNTLKVAFVPDYRVNSLVANALATYDAPTNAEMVARTLASASYATATALATLQSAVDVVDGIVDTILVDTNELQTDWVNGGRLDNILDARASQTSVDVIDSIVDAILADTVVLGTPAGATFAADIAALLTAIQTINSSFKKNTAKNNFVFSMRNATTGALITGLTPAGTRSLDSAAFASLANAISEIGSTGYYKVNLAAGDLNGDTVFIRVTGTLAADKEFFIVTKA